MNQDSSINNIRKSQNTTQTITNTDVPPTSKENRKNKSDIKMKLIISAENLENRTNEMKIKGI